MWSTFGSEEAQQRDDRKLIRMRSADNPYLPQDFIERLQANYDPSLLQAYLEGQFCNLTTGQVYDRFDRSKHVTTQIPDVSREPLRVGVDFNVGNMSAVIGVRLGENLLLIDEISGAHDTDAMAQEIQRRADGRQVYMYLTHLAATEARMPHERTFRSWSPTGLAINRQRPTLPSVIGWLLFKLCWRTGKAK